MPDAPDNTVTSGDVQDLAVAVEQLTDQVRTLGEDIDAARDDFVWAVRKLLEQETFVPTRPITSMPADPLAADFAARLNRVDPRSVPDSHVTRDGHDGVATPVESNDGPTYCCALPNLQWSGAPDAPGIACANCGYVVAELGSVVIWRAEDDEPGGNGASSNPPVAATTRQGNLFE